MCDDSYHNDRLRGQREIGDKLVRVSLFCRAFYTILPCDVDDLQEEEHREQLAAPSAYRVKSAGVVIRDRSFHCLAFEGDNDVVAEEER